MARNGHKPTLKTEAKPPVYSPIPQLLEWDWDVEHDDRKREEVADAALHGATPFQVDRRMLRDVVREKSGVDVGRIIFLSACKLRFHSGSRSYHLHLSKHRHIPQSKIAPKGHFVNPLMSKL